MLDHPSRLRDRLRLSGRIDPTPIGQAALASTLRDRQAYTEGCIGSASDPTARQCADPRPPDRTKPSSRAARATLLGPAKHDLSPDATNAACCTVDKAASEKRTIGPSGAINFPSSPNRFSGNQT
jgi:hypothetical protein